MMAKNDRARIARVYAWCRYTDNLVDGDGSVELAERMLAGWLNCPGLRTMVATAASSS
jgi:phytoene/squalene synthetase